MKKLIQTGISALLALSMGMECIAGFTPEKYKEENMLPVLAAQYNKDGLSQSTICNVTVETATDKESYQNEDTILFTAKILNGNNFDITNINLNTILPIGLISENTTSLQLEKLEANTDTEYMFVIHRDSTVARISGDANGDREIDTKDAVLIKKYLAGFENLFIDVTAGDVTGDGEITTKDAVRLLQYLAGYSVELENAQVGSKAVARENNNVAREVSAESRLDVDGYPFKIVTEVSFEYQEPELPEDEDITLRYQLWEYGPETKIMTEEWERLHPNIKIEVEEVISSENNMNLISLSAAGDLPDLYWILGTPDFAIDGNMLTDMTSLWESDADTKNTIGGINEFGLGTLETGKRFTMPVKFFPETAWLNMNYFRRNNFDMPSTNWTFEEMKDLVEDITIDNKGSGWGISGRSSIINWYPIAAGSDCIGEFGWNGEEFDLKDWAEGMKIEKNWREYGLKAPANMEGLPGYEDGGAQYYPQDEGLVGIYLREWRCWEWYWNKDEMYAKDVCWVPYIMPHTKANKSSDTYLSIMDFGGISSTTTYPKQAYQALKFFTWGADGWQYKIQNRDEIIATIINKELISMSGVSAHLLDNCPITLDETTWDMYEAAHPSKLSGGDRYGEEQLGLNRAPYFDAYFDKVRKSKWTCYGNGQILGFDEFLADIYQGNIDGFAGVEDWVFEAGGDPYEYVNSFTKKANEIHQKYKDKYAAE